MNKYVVYTSVTGGYDNIPQYKVIHPEFDYICFSNDYPDGSIQGIWKIKKIPFHSKDNIQLSRYTKLLPHLVLKKYDYSLWIDSNLIINTIEFYSYVMTRIKEGGLWYGIKHFERDCIYEEAIRCVDIAYSGYFETRRQLLYLKSSGFPKHYGLFENNIILRNHNNIKIKKIDDEWWKIFNKFTKRDQLSLFFIFWKYNYKPMYLLQEGMTSRNVEMIWFSGHNKRSSLKKIQNKLRSIINKTCERISPLSKFTI